jgi:DNA-binding Lrp family transcriptional regulator
MLDRRYVDRYRVVLDQVTDEWRSRDDIVQAVRRRTRVSGEALWQRLRRLEAAGSIERRGRERNYEWRRVPSAQ